MWREGLHIINENYATTQELDRAIEDGPGLRYSIMGTFLTFHLAGGNEGMKHMLKQFGPALKLPWTKLKAPKLTNKLSNKLISGTKKQAKGKSINMLSNIRDQYLVDVLKIRKNMRIKLEIDERKIFINKTGGCICGDITFNVKLDEVPLVFNCHCIDCRKK